MHAFNYPSVRQTSSLKVRICVTKQHSRLLQLQMRDHMTWVYFLHARWKLPCCLASLAILLNMPSLSLASVPWPGVMASAIVCRTCNLADLPSLCSAGAHQSVCSQPCKTTACSCLCFSHELESFGGLTKDLTCRTCTLRCRCHEHQRSLVRSGRKAKKCRAECMSAVGFEPTPFRTSALSWRLRPLGQANIPRCRIAIYS